jgi:hypothetical protein
MKWMKNKLNIGLRQHNWQFRDLIKLWITLINQIKGLNWRVVEFWDLIEIKISLINEIKGFNWKNIKVWGWFGSKLQGIKIQRSNWKGRGTIGSLIDFSRGNFERIKSWRVNEGLNWEI